MRFLTDLFGVDLNKFDIKHRTYNMEVLWTDDGKNYLKLFALSPTWFVFKDFCGLFNPRVGSIILVQKDKKGRVISEIEYTFSSRKFYKTEYYKNNTVEYLYHYNHKDEIVCEKKFITTYRDNKKVSTTCYIAL